MPSEGIKFQCKCGSTMFYEKHPVRGTWKTLYDGACGIETVDTNLDGIKYGNFPKTVSCAECGKKHPNPRCEAK